MPVGSAAPAEPPDGNNHLGQIQLCWTFVSKSGSWPMEVPSQALIASVLDCIESEAVGLEEVTSFSGFTKGFGK